MHEFRRLFDHAMAFIVLAHILTLWMSVYSFAKQFSDKNMERHAVRQLSWMFLQSQYESLKDASNKINNTLGAIIAVHLMDIILAYAMFTETLFSVSSQTTGLEWINNVHTMNFVCCYAAIIFFAADVTRKVS